MKICFPTEDLQGLDSRVHGHFGTAPGFVMVETDTMRVSRIVNEDLHHAHGMCQPLKALGGERVDGIVVGGIGLGALTKLRSEGIEVYRASEGTVKENLELIGKGRLPTFDPARTCGGQGGGCGHH